MKAMTLPFFRRAAAPAGNVVALAPRFDLRRSLRRRLRALGWPGVLGIALLAMAAGLYLSLVEPTREQLRQTRQAATTLRQEILQADRDLKGEARTPAEQLAQFYRLFPDEKDLPIWLGKIFTAAQGQGLVLEQGEYKTSRTSLGTGGGDDDRLLRYEISLPVKGEYPQIRRFLAGLAKDVPIAGLEHIQFERQKVGTAQVDCKIMLVLFLEQRP